ncbi:MAG: hypothetical protein QOH36_2326 [Actinomycetota bacterium]|nr:hypothetical protein [Actinomycetota bacterium]
MRRLAAVGVLAAALATGVACGGKDEPRVPTATVPPGTTTTNPYAVPEVIDEAYVNRVLAGLDQRVGDITRLVIESRALSPEALDQLRTIYVGDSLELSIKGFQGDVRADFAGYRQPPGNKTTTVTELITARPTCIFAKVHKDFSAVGVDPDPSLATQWVALVPSDTVLDPSGYNPTRWVFTYDGFRRDLSAPPDPCAAS